MQKYKRKEVFCIPYPKNKSAFCKRFGMNAYWSGKHWSQRKSDADDVHQRVRLALRQANIPRTLFEGPVRIVFCHNDRMDIDNHAALEKMIVDALKGWILRDDSRKYYAERVSKFHDEDNVRIEVEAI